LVLDVPLSYKKDHRGPRHQVDDVEDQVGFQASPSSKGTNVAREKVV
jgi:hypothetical protein